MKNWKPLALGIATATFAAATYVVAPHWTRSVGPMSVAGVLETGTFDSAQSAALFVGVSEFEDDRIWPVPYAVDDAIDLAYMFAIDPRVRLVAPERVILALSGKPQKNDSLLRLEELKSAGAQIRGAGESDILMALDAQASSAGKDGMLIVSFATHGFNDGGVPYLLGSTSIFRFPDTALSTASLFEIAASSPAQRSLILVDACRETIEKGTRAGARDERTAAPLLEKMGTVRGQVVFYAAAAGGYSHDDPVRRNGVFTKAVLDGLHCGASSSKGGVVTVETLHKFVEREVKKWIRTNRDRSIGAATQINIDGSTSNMPLACCSPKPCWPFPEGPHRVSSEGSAVIAFDKDGKRLWAYDSHEPVVKAIIADLDADGRNEVVVGTQSRIIALDGMKKELWSSSDEGLALHTFATGPLFGKHAQRVVAVWNDRHSRASFVTILSDDGQSLAGYEYDDRLQDIVMYQPTNRHHYRIVASAKNEVLLIEPNKPDRFRWRHPLPPGETIARMSIVDRDKRRGISISTSGGRTFVLDLDGQVIAPAR